MAGAPISDSEITDAPVLQTIADARKLNPQLMHKLGAVRNRLIKSLRNENPRIGIAALQWIYMDLLICNFTKQEAEEIAKAQYDAVMLAVNKMNVIKVT